MNLTLDDVKEVAVSGPTLMNKEGIQKQYDDKKMYADKTGRLFIDVYYMTRSNDTRSIEVAYFDVDTEEPVDSKLADDIIWGNHPFRKSQK